jgi:KDO2-lipid IV(A) lauroyltransferase
LPDKYRLFFWGGTNILTTQRLNKIKVKICGRIWKKLFRQKRSAFAVKQAVDHIMYDSIMFLTRSIGTLPYRWGLGIGAWLGYLSYRLFLSRRDVTLKNLRDAYPEKSEGDIRDIAMAVFRNMGKLFYEICWFTCMDDDELLGRVNISGMEHIQAAYKRGRGVLVLTAHFGNWELMPVIGAHLKYPCSYVYRPLNAPVLEKFLARTRTRFGGKKIPKKRSFRKILKFLGQKGLVFLLMDQNVQRKESVFVPFFNQTAATNKGLALLALKTGAPVVPIFLIREESGFKGLILPEVPLIDTGEKEKDIEANTLAYNRVIESVVRRHPDQWFWVHRRWKTKPMT